MAYKAWLSSSITTIAVYGCSTESFCGQFFPNRLPHEPGPQKLIPTLDERQAFFQSVRTIGMYICTVLSSKV
jgi:hypothetical protein